MRILNPEALILFSRISTGLPNISFILTALKGYVILNADLHTRIILSNVNECDILTPRIHSLEFLVKCVWYVASKWNLVGGTMAHSIV